MVLDYPELIDLYHFQNDFHGKKKKSLDIFLSIKKLQRSTNVFWIGIQFDLNSGSDQN